MFLAGAFLNERKPGHEAPMAYSLQLWEGLASIPVSDTMAITIGRAVVLVPFSAFQYAAAMHRSLGNDLEADELLSDLKDALGEAKSSSKAGLLDAWERLADP